MALGNQERMLALEIMTERAASPVTVQALLRNAEALGEGARSGGRVGYKRGAEDALAFPLAFKAAYFVIAASASCASRRSAGRPVRNAAHSLVL